ncbi:hypothetical protein C8J57DRAFT_222257 [Mycena rebaudengoi]|nr:hypothetical protein C8J57DRAFT_222257 [Mycena rebaudengoi]
MRPANWTPLQRMVIRIPTRTPLPCSSHVASPSLHPPRCLTLRICHDATILGGGTISSTKRTRFSRVSCRTSRSMPWRGSSPRILPELCDALLPHVTTGRVHNPRSSSSLLYLPNEYPRASAYPFSSLPRRTFHTGRCCLPHNVAALPRCDALPPLHVDPPRGSLPFSPLCLRRLADTPVDCQRQSLRCSPTTIHRTPRPARLLGGDSARIPLNPVSLSARRPARPVRTRPLHIRSSSEFTVTQGRAASTSSAAVRHAIARDGR